VGLFAEKYFLAELPYFDPWSVRCTRSADGWKIAYTNPIFGQGTTTRNQAGWVDLAHPEQLNKFANDLQINELAFSPDSRYLAYIQSNYLTNGSVFILDTETGEIRNLSQVQSSFSLTWSPDGNFLAVVSDQYKTDFAMVIDVQTGDITDMTSIPRNAAGQPVYWPSKGRPWNEWKVQFPVTMKGIDGCYKP
jgi:Tol biopolymer transport system component